MRCNALFLATLALAMAIAPPTALSASSPITTTQPSPQVLVRVTAPNDGFDWGDAGVGAAGGVGLSMLGVAGALTVSQRRHAKSTTRRTT